ncbi:MAG TPA: phosphotransferase family protein [Candidatus Acidoferrum sp.]|jgi:aminoglycoside phosphotransferase (APT) family kinase protein
MAETFTIAMRPGEELDVSALENHLQRYFPEQRGPLEVRQFPSGHSNLTYSVRFGEREMVLRKPPFGSKVKSAHDMGREFRVLSKLHDAYSPAPKVLLYCDDQAVIGAPFYLMEPIPGIILRRDVPAGLDFSPQIARRLSASFIDNLAKLHSLDYAAVGLGDLGKPQGYVERQVKGWTERYYGAQTHDLEEVERITKWMQQNMPAHSEVALIHNDYKYDNVVLDANDITRIVGVLDWEMCTIGDPLTDVGTALTYWVDPHDSEELKKLRWGPTNVAGSLTRAELLNRYAEKTGRDVSRMVFYLTFARFKVAVIVQQIYYRYHQGFTLDERFASMPELIKVLLRASWECAETNSI